MKLAKSGLEDDGVATRAAMGAIENVRFVRDHELQATRRFVIVSVSPGSPNHALLPLRMAFPDQSLLRWTGVIAHFAAKWDRWGRYFLHGSQRFAHALPSNYPKACRDDWAALKRHWLHLVG